MNHVIIGAGYFGYNLAVTLSGRGEEVTVLDKEIEKINALRDIVSRAIQVDATDKEMLKKVLPSDLDQAVVSIGKDLEASLVVCLSLKDLGVKRIVAKCHSPEHEKILRLMGVDLIIDPEKQMAVYLADRMVEPSIIDYLTLEAGFKIVKANAPKVLQNKKLKDLDVRNKFGINIIGIKKKQADSSYNFDMAPSGDTVIVDGDIIIASGREQDIAKLF